LAGGVFRDSEIAFCVGVALLARLIRFIAYRLPTEEKLREAASEEAASGLWVSPESRAISEYPNPQNIRWFNLIARV
jgi:hypothetical protein